VAYDITNRTLSEAEQARLQRELEQAQKMEALGQLTGGIAHDFNNSLGIILGYTSLARTIGIDGEPEKLDKYLAKVEMAGERTRKLIAQMLAFSRSGSSSAEPLYLEQLVREDIKLLRPTLPSSVEIRSRIASDLPPVEIEPVQVNQLLMNLSINARDAMNGSGVISYSLSLAKDLQAECSCCHRKVEGDWVELSVADTGSGIEAQHMNKLFEPFFTTKEVGKGTGMGLSVIHGIVSGCGGRILVESQVGKGARFRLLFPPVAGHEGAAAIEKEAMPSLAAGSGQHILIVDDEPALCSFLSELLQHQGYRTTVHSSSVRALKLLQQRSHGFDLLITDQTMPRITGLDLVSRARESNPDLPVILCSGYSEEIDSEGAAGLDISYLDKPVASGTLLEVVAGKLAAAESGSSERCAAAS
jgi:nitrogen-specific signal transduction histidine kinase/ActR/RegA family two-component response regulator